MALRMLLGPQVVFLMSILDQLLTCTQLLLSIEDLASFLSPHIAFHYLQYTRLPFNFPLLPELQVTVAWQVVTSLPQGPVTDMQDVIVVAAVKCSSRYFLHREAVALAHPLDFVVITTLVVTTELPEEYWLVVSQVFKRYIVASLNLYVQLSKVLHGVALILVCACYKKQNCSN